MIMDNEGLCDLCKKKPVIRGERVCRGCAFKLSYLHELSLPEQDRDWSFAVCEECGSWLDADGLCDNTGCGNSPFQGTDWY